MQKFLIMKKIIVVIVALFTIVACNKVEKNEFIIEGTAKGFENGKKLFLQIRGEEALITQDTITIQDEKFSLKGKIENPDLAFLTLEDNNGLPFILEEGVIKIDVMKDSLQNSTIGGTTENDIFQKYTDESKVFYKKINTFKNANMEKYNAAQTANDTTTMNALQKSIEAIQDDLKKIPVSYVDKYNDRFVSIVLLENLLMSKALTAEEVKTKFENLKNKFPKTKSSMNITKSLDKMLSVAIGNKALEFSGPSPDGKIISLKESLGKATIIDFWASWCGPCRAENPNVVAMYTELHPKGLNIIGVSLDKDGDKWKEAIAKDKLEWIHISNLQQWQDPIAQMYSIQQIPSTILLDANGIIVAKDLRGEELKAKVIELLAK